MGFSQKRVEYWTTMRQLIQLCDVRPQIFLLQGWYQPEGLTCSLVGYMDYCRTTFDVHMVLKQYLILNISTIWENPDVLSILYFYLEVILHFQPDFYGEKHKRYTANVKL